MKGETAVEEMDYLKNLKHKDESALVWFIERYAAYVNTIIYSIIGNSMSAEDVEEVSSDVFYTLWVNAKRVKPDKVKAYLSGVARNKAKEYTRKIRKEVSIEEDILIVSSEDLERKFEIKEQAIFIKKTILKLPYPDREIFLRHYYYCQPLTRISQEMNINISTIKTKLHRGRKKLKEIIIEGGYKVES